VVRRSRGVFAQRVLQFGEIHSLSIDPARATATLSYRLADGDADGFPTRLAAAGAGEGMDDAELPHWPDGETVTLHRHLGIVSTIEILSLANGRLDARHPAMARDLTARRFENARCGSCRGGDLGDRNQYQGRAPGVLRSACGHGTRSDPARRGRALPSDLGLWEISDEIPAQPAARPGGSPAGVVCQPGLHVGAVVRLE
jgi:hypothetical protein